MPAIKNVNLTIGSKPEESFCQVVVTYNINFSSFEIQAKTMFIENVTLLRSNQIMDNKLTTLSNSCIFSVNSCVDRCISAEVQKSKLKEDWELSVYGIPVQRENYMIYACVNLTYFNPGNTYSCSNVMDVNIDVKENSSVNCV